MLTADVSRGTANDYSAFMVFDITEIPYRVVAKFRDNEIKPLLFPTKIHEVAKAYNEAYVMVEVNDIGEQVANTLQFDLEYDNLVISLQSGPDTWSGLLWRSSAIGSKNNKSSQESWMLKSQTTN